MKLYHVSEDPGITEFHPRPSPQKYEGINGNVVFAVSEDMLHNYLLPRDCPRVTFYAKQILSKLISKLSYVIQRKSIKSILKKAGWERSREQSSICLSYQ